MNRYVKWILFAVVAVAMLLILIFGFRHVNAKDTYVTKIVAIENALNEISDSVEILTGVPAAHIEIPEEYSDVVKKTADTPVPEDTEEPEHTDTPESEEPSPTATPSAAANTTPIPNTPRPVYNTPIPAVPPEGDEPGPGDNETEPGAENTPAPPAETSGPEETSEPGVDHEHAWVTQTDGYYVDDVERVLVVETIVDQEEYTDEDGGYHPAVTHEESHYEEHPIQRWVEETRTFCAICGVVA